MYNGERLKPSVCKRCGRPTFWAFTIHHRRHPLDLKPVEDGPLMLIEGPKNEPIIIGWSKFQAADEKRFTSHARTCPVQYDGPRYKTESSASQAEGE